MYYMRRQHENQPFVCGDVGQLRLFRQGDHAMRLRPNIGIYLPAPLSQTVARRKHLYALQVRIYVYIYAYIHTHILYG